MTPTTLQVSHTPIERHKDPVKSHWEPAQRTRSNSGRRNLPQKRIPDRPVSWGKRLPEKPAWKNPEIPILNSVFPVTAWLWGHSQARKSERLLCYNKGSKGNQIPRKGQAPCSRTQTKFPTLFSTFRRAEKLVLAMPGERPREVAESNWELPGLSV